MNFLLPAPKRISFAPPGATGFIDVVLNIRKLAIQIALRLCCAEGVEFFLAQFYTPCIEQRF
ncbi:hypothetical protein, partial [Serratia marcescens]|uniref:hypothetical protein n=1 Tax=Serratia marcescens TaxID=615 RepID=UPI001CAA863E